MNNSQFSTFDADHDKYEDLSCARVMYSANWYGAGSCGNQNVNRHYDGNGLDSWKVLSWGYHKHLKKIQLTVRPAAGN